MKCPKCKEQINIDNRLMVEKEFKTGIVDFKNEETDVDMIASGYTSLYDFIENMLVETGKKKVIGCESCQ